jgi:plastocyanin
MDQPNTFNIELGDTVEWTNDDSAPHTVTEKNEFICSNDESNAGTVDIRNNLGGGGDGGAE